MTERRTLRTALLPLLLLLLLLPACRPASQPQAAAATATGTPASTATLPPSRTPRVITETAAPTATLTAEPTAAPTNTPAPVPWTELPVVPAGLSPAMLEVYARGLELGNDPRAFVKVGDCGVEASYFLVDYDREKPYHPLDEERASLQAVIDYFAGSFGRHSVAGRNGANTAGLLSTRWADRSQCQPDENPLACEYRIMRPSFALIMLGTNDAGQPEKFAENLRLIVEYSLEQGVVPVLSTKADDLEGGHRINAAIAEIAYDYQLPVWNYWAAVQPLPNGGLQPDGAHLTFAPSRFDDPIAMQTAWPWRNLTALQVLEMLMHSVTKGGTP